MKIKELLSEAPLPDDWDKSTYTNRNSFNKRVQYAKERAKRMGTGSSRIAFEIEYEGRPTILKIAKNKKGLAQNEYEADALGDYYLKGLDITIPMIDYDEENDPPTWIHVEKAEKMRLPQFRKFFNGMNPEEFMLAVNYMVGRDDAARSHAEENNLVDTYEKMYEENDAYNGVVMFVGNYEISPQEFSIIQNWGIYNNKPVIIDIGGSSEVISQHYS